MLNELSIVFSGLVVLLSFLLLAFSNQKNCPFTIQILFAYFGLYYLVYSIGQYSNIDFINSLVISLGFIEGPILLSVVLTYSVGKKSVVNGLHLVPAIISMTVLMIYPAAMIDSLYNAAAFSRALYAGWCLVFLWGVRKEAIRQKWYQWIILFVVYITLLAGVKIISASLHILYSDFQTPAWIIFVKTAGAAFIVLCLLWWALMKPEIYNLISKEDTNGDKKTTALDNVTYGKMLHLFDVDEIYTDMDLNLGKTADLIGVTERELSIAVNRVANQGFRAVLRQYRIKKACYYLTDKHDHDRTILDISLDSGFASKSVFNVAFREDTGLTPSAYRLQFTTK